MSESTHSVADNGTTYVRVGLNGLIQTSTNGEDWTAQTSGVSTTLWAVVWGEGLFVVVGDSGVILTSPTGTTWTARASGTAEDLHDVAYADNFVAVGDAGTVLISEDGIAWGSVPSQTTENLWGVSAGSGSWLACGDNETIIAGDLLTLDLDASIEDGVGASGSISAAGSTYNVTASESMELPNPALHDLEREPKYEYLSETVLQTDDGTDALGAFVQPAADTAQLNDRPFINNEAVSDAVTLSSAILGYYGRTLVEAVEIDESAVALFQAHGEITDDLTADDALVVSGVWITALSDGLTVDDTLSAGQIIQQALSEGVVFAVGLSTGADAYTGWVMNTSNYAMTQYTNFAFNSYARLNGAALGANDSGIYVLTGTDDAGTAIAARARTGITDFGVSNLKRVIEAYLGIRNDGAMVVKTITDEGKERWYEMRQTNAGIHRSRCKLGRGVQANYWQFELLNKDGDDFELDSIALTPIVLTRKLSRTN